MLVANTVANSTNLFLELLIRVIAFLSSGTPTTGCARQLDAAAPLLGAAKLAGVRYVQAPPRVTSCACRKASPACATAPTNWNEGP
jgi:hypothetical protein